jgi:Tol biopolymer transport system component
MKELLLVDVQSPLLKSAIYLLDANGARNNITSDFLRADFPVWSQKRNLIAFLGTKPYLGDDDKIKQFSQLESRVDYPWRLYIYDPQSLTTKEISLDIVHPSSLKWSPNGTILAFSGKYNGAEGVWIVNHLDSPESISVNRIIKDLATFDFSPDGKSIAFAYIGLQNKDKQNILFMVDLPEQ